MKKYKEKEEGLATYAVHESKSPGRKIEEQSPKDRNEFQRDYSRIIHSNAWRKLQYKTQVFANNEGDNFRTRATHSLEVSQVSQSVANELKLNEDLATTLAVSHDLGHAPFGHKGQDVLDELMKDYGGFEHNMQALRIVDSLEKAYPGFNGLNLMFETKEGLLKHYNEKTALVLGECGDDSFFALGKTPSLEAQLVNICDSIAYNHGDLEDGYLMGFLRLEQLMELDQFSDYWNKFSSTKTGFGDNEFVAVKEVIRNMFTSFAKNLVSYSRTNIKSSGVGDLYDVKNSQPLIKFGKKAYDNHKTLKKFLKDNLYYDPRMSHSRENQEIMLKYIFNSLIENPNLINESLLGVKQDRNALHRSVCDYVSGMTDRSVIGHYKNLKNMTFQEKMEAKEDMELQRGYSLKFGNRAGLEIS